MIKLRILIALALIFACASGNAQNMSNKGTDFWVGFGHHQFFETGQTTGWDMVLYLSAEQAATVTVSINGTGYSQTYNVPANSVVVTAPIPRSPSSPYDARLYNPSTNSEGIFDRGIHIESNVPIVAYSHIYGASSSGATMLMPSNTWGNTYTSLNSKQNYGSNCFSWTYVIAKENNTKVEIIPSVPTRGGKAAGVPFQVVLNKGQIYQVLGAIISGSDGYEMTGTKVKSIANSNGECFPIAVFSGSSRTSNPASCGSGGGDNDMQQLFPLQAWGKQYLLAPTSLSSSASNFQTNTYKILVSDPTTVVKRNGITLTNLLNNTYYTFETSSTAYITSDKPVMVAQFMTGGPCSGVTTPNPAGNVGDPEMIYLSPLEQGIKRIGFYRNTLQGITVNYLTLIIPTNGVNSLTIDGSSSFSYTYLHPNLAGYTVVVKRWTAAQEQCIVQSDSAFTAITYGLGSVESYGYNAGTLINNLNVQGNILNVLDSTANVLSHPYTCKNTPFELSMLVAYQPTKMIWNLSQVPVLTPHTDVTVNNPVPVGTVTVNGTVYYKYSLPGTYVFQDTGTFQVPVRNFHPSIDNCNNSEVVSFTLQSKKQPTSDFTYTHTGCLSDTVAFNSPVATGNGYNANHWKWTFDDGTILTGPSVTKLFGTAGTQGVKLDIITSEGCLGDTLRNINIFNKPQTTITALPEQICQGGSISFTETSTYSGSAPVNGFHWNFDNGTITNPTTNAAQTIAFATPGTYTVKHAVRVSPTCVSDTATKIITVFAKPNIGFTYPAGCLPSDGVVQFNNTTTVADGQTIDYSWNFGDAGATSSNPNTSTSVSPTHTYANFGNYTIALTATTANGCVKDTTIQATFNVRPVLAYSPLTTTCENTVGTISVSSGSVTNAVPGTGVYHGPATTNAGQFSPSTAGPGTHRIWYVFTSNGGCTDSVSQDITVYAKAKPAFSFPSNCLPTTGLVQFTNNSTVADGQTLNYNWSFGDPNASSSNPNTSTQQAPAHTYSNTGTYPIKLSITTANGCASDTTITATFSVKPLLTFNALSPVCENLTTGNVAFGTVTNGVTGTGIYSGPGTSSSGIFNPSAAGAGTHTIKYVFTSTGGCADSLSRTITVNPKPTSAFTLTNDICLGGTASVSDASTISSGTIANWNWNYGNGTLVTNSNGNGFTIPYTTHGSYTVKLATVSSQGCVSDTVSHNIGVHAVPFANFNLPAGVCMPNGQAVFANASTVADNSALTYQWTFGDGVGNSTAASPTYTYTTVSGPVSVHLTVTSPYGCVKDTTKVLSAFFDKPVAKFNVLPAELCQGVTNTFTNTSTAPNSTVTSWEWNFGDGTTSTSQTPVKKYTRPGTFQISLIVKNAFGCTSDPDTHSVLVHLQPVIDAGPSFVIAQGKVITFRPVVNSTTGVSYTWSPTAGLSNANTLYPSITATNNQTYTLTAIGEGDCMATDTMSVKILMPVTVPNAFSPNGDGVHDKWEIPNLIDYPGCSVEVFNRYGQMVYQSVGYGRAWDGTYQGKPLPFATYYYIITLKNGFAPVTGSVTIVK